jgi:DNA-binding CsgD family transcriptional regulator
MMQYFVYLVFILSVAMAAGGVVLASRLRNTFHHEIFSTLLYFQVFIFTFGFYGIWGQVIINAFLATYISAELLKKFSEVSMLLGLPFLVFAWLMLVNLFLGLSGRKNKTWFSICFLFLNCSAIVIIGYFITRANDVKPESLIKYYFIIMNCICSFSCSLLILFPNKGRLILHDNDRKIISFFLFLIMIIQCVPLLFNISQAAIALIFIFTFFSGNTFLPVYLNYGTKVTLLIEVPEKDLSLEEFCRKYEVSPRETDIIREICNGLSNQEISVKLFISLQTVKDHSHRIYSKTNVRSRVQLINLVKANTSS